MAAGRFKVLKEKAAAVDASIDLVFQPETQNYEENSLEDGKIVITEMLDKFDDDLSIGNEDHEEQCTNMDIQNN
eukprot:12355553-Ditylum_brightwellii.AAC.1